MDNPFKKRATEFIEEPRAFLPLVSPKPIDEFFSADRDEIFEKYTMIVGTPGCGKTTIAKIVEFDTLSVLSKEPALNKELAGALQRHNILDKRIPTILAFRLEMSTNFRSIWELPYSESVRATLLRAFVQSKAVLGWFRQITKAGIDIEAIKVRLKDDAESAATIMGAHNAAEFREYARRIEEAIFKIVTALVAPDEARLTDAFNTSYDVFEQIVGFDIAAESLFSTPSFFVKPMIIVDDAHELHPRQFIGLGDWLKSRSIRIARWVMCRPDAVSPEDYREVLASETTLDEKRTPGTSRGRDYLIKDLQLGAREARRFKLIAQDISSRYINKIPELARRSINDLAHCLTDTEKSLHPGQISQLEQQITKIAKEAGFSSQLVESLRSRIPPATPKDVALGVLRILMARERRRTPQLTLISDESRDEPITEDRAARSSLVGGAKIQLMHEFDRPYYFGFDSVSAASNINIEQFVGLSGALIDQLLARIIRGQQAELSARTQHDAMVKQAKSVMDEWDFPYHASVKQLVATIAEKCVEKTMQPNAPLDEGANAIGILQSDMDILLQKSERLARILHFAFAYRALVYIPNYRCKKKVWCLLELGAIPCLSYGLTLSRGGFLEESLSTLQSFVD